MFGEVFEKPQGRFCCKESTEKGDFIVKTATFNVSPAIISWALNQTKHNAVPLRSIETLESWLNSEKAPSYEKIKEVSKDTHIPFGYFFLKNPPEEKLELLEFRTIKNNEYNSPSRELIECVRNMKQVIFWTRNNLIEENVGKCSVVGALKETDNKDSIVNFVRTTLSLEENWFCKSANAADSFRRLREIISNLGIIVTLEGRAGNSNARAFDLNEFRAFTIIDDYAPLIFINSKDTDNGKLFSLLHEFTHICLGKNNLFNDRYNSTVHIDKLETLCNKVSAEILVPTELLKKQWERCKDKDVLSIVDNCAKYFRCSKLVIAKKAYDISLINFESYKKVYDCSIQNFEKRKSADRRGPSYYVTLASHVDKRFFTMLYSSVLDGRTRYTEAFRLTNTNRKTFEGLALQYGL